jgi:hypothetical protein
MTLETNDGGNASSRREFLRRLAVGAALTAPAIMTLSRVSPAAASLGPLATPHAGPVGHPTTPHPMPPPSDVDLMRLAENRPLQ